LRERYGTEALVEWTEPDGTPRRERTGTPTRTIAGLMRRFDGEIPGLAVSRPTLEDVYLRLTGQRQEDAR
jgi:ABC-2 type transport system ATP-binding protein